MKNYSLSISTNSLYVYALAHVYTFINDSCIEDGKLFYTGSLTFLVLHATDISHLYSHFTGSANTFL